jgi:hypothetical protein
MTGTMAAVLVPGRFAHSEAMEVAPADFQRLVEVLKEWPARVSPSRCWDSRLAAQV